MFIVDVDMYMAYKFMPFPALGFGFQLAEMGTTWKSVVKNIAKNHIITKQLRILTALTIFHVLNILL